MHPSSLGVHWGLQIGSMIATDPPLLYERGRVLSILRGGPPEDVGFSGF
jgi:hypothetical protein